ncbi:hypothetical protein B0H19DRAFT_1123992 [Mycena capillaripes]|nr:hypothetical protein B0H19DRAFT_1123992 [Mycena capillaripes]
MVLLRGGRQTACAHSKQVCGMMMHLSYSLQWHSGIWRVQMMHPSSRAANGADRYQSRFASVRPVDVESTHWRQRRRWRATQEAEWGGKRV